MLKRYHKDYLLENGFSESQLKTESVYWIYNYYFNIAVKENCYDLFSQDYGSMKLLATICTELDLESFIVLMDAFGLVQLNNVS